MTNAPIPQFYIYKETPTIKERILIVSPQGVKFDKLNKMAFYLQLGYSVADLDESKTITWDSNN